MLGEEVPEFILKNLLIYQSMIPHIEFIDERVIHSPFVKLAKIESIINKRDIIKEIFNTSFNWFSTYSICYREFDEKYAVEYIILKYLEKQMTLNEMRRKIVFEKYIQDILDNICGIVGEKIWWPKGTKKLVVNGIKFLQENANSTPVIKCPQGIRKFIKFIEVIKESIFSGKKLKGKEALKVIADKLEICIKIGKFDIKTDKIDIELINESRQMVISMQMYAGHYWMLYERNDIVSSLVFDNLKEEVNQYMKEHRKTDISEELIKYISWGNDKAGQYCDESIFLTTVRKAIEKTIYSKIIH